MSPQSRAATAITQHPNFASRDDGCCFSSNPCSGASSDADIARAATLHKIESESSATPATLLLHHHQATRGAKASLLSRKRSSTRISMSPKNELFLSSYGSAFLSGIFADIGQASLDDQPQDEDGADPATATADTGSEPCNKKARTTASTSFGRQLKSYMALAGLAEGTVGGEISAPHVVSPRSNTLKIQLVDDDQVQKLQDLAFPSLPHIPMAVSSSSCSLPSMHDLSPRGDAMKGVTNEEDEDTPSYGWFVSTDDAEAGTTDEDQDKSSSSMFLPDAKPDLAFSAAASESASTLASAGNQDLEVQQALAADTIDDVLVDLF